MGFMNSSAIDLFFHQLSSLWSFFLNRIFFMRFYCVIRPAYENKLTLQQLPDLDGFFNMKSWTKEFEKRIQQEHQRPKGFRRYATFRILLSMFFIDYALIFLLSILCIVLHVCESIVLKQIVENMKKAPITSSSSVPHTWLYIVILIIFEISISFLDPHIRFWIRCLTIRVHKVLSISLFERFVTYGFCQSKVTESNVETRKSSNQINVFVLLAADCDNLSDSLTFMMDTIIALIIITVMIYSAHVWNSLPSRIALAVLAFLLVITLTSEFISVYYQRALLVLRDKRLECIQKTLDDIKNIKILNWDSIAAKDIHAARQKEIHVLKFQTFFIYLSSVINQNLSHLICLVFFAVFYLQNVMGINLTAAEIISTQLALYHLLRPLSHFSRNIQGILYGLSSCKRFDQFYSLSFRSSSKKKTRSSSTITHNSLFEASKHHTETDKCVVIIKNAMFSRKLYGSETLLSQHFSSFPPLHAIHQISSSFGDMTHIKHLRLDYDQCVIVVGQRGSGKTSLFSGLLNEIYLAQGDIHWFPYRNSSNTVKCTLPCAGPPFSIAYCGQTPWLPFGTVREAILFNRPYNEQLYRRVVDICQLSTDFSSWQSGDHYIITEDCRSVSRGQRVRIALARCLYGLHDSRVCFLDAPFDVLDVQTGLTIFRSLFGENGFLKHSATILSIGCEEFYFFLQSVTIPCVQFLLYEMRSGVLHPRSFQTTEVLKDISNMNNSLVLNNMAHQRTASPTRQSILSTNAAAPGVNIPTENIEYSVSPNFIITETRDHTNFPTVLDDMTYHATTPQQAFLYYFRYFGYKTGLFLCFLLFLYRVLLCLAFCWTVFYGSTSKVTETNNASVRQLSEMFMLSPRSKSLRNSESLTRFTQGVLSFTKVRDLGTLSPSVANQVLHEPIVYVAVASLAVLTLFSVMALQGYCLARAALLIHEKLVDQFLKANFLVYSFFPTGAILNKFSIDTNVLDLSFTLSLSLFISMVANLIVLIGVIFIFTPYLAAVVFCVFSLVIFFVKHRYVPANRELQRIRLACLTPVSSLLADAQNAMMTIRAFQQQSHFLQNNFDAVLNVLHTEFTIAGLSSWLYILQRLISLPLIFYISIASFTRKGLSISSIGMTFLRFFNFFLPDNVEAEIFGFTAFQAFTIPFLLGFALCQCAEFQGRLCSIQRIVDMGQLLTLKEDTARPQRSYSLHPNMMSSNESGLRIHQLVAGYVKLVEKAEDGTRQFSFAHSACVLRGLSIYTSLSQIVALVGRTGSGKTTLLLTLLRQTPIISGSISLSGIRLDTLMSHELRTFVAYIPEQITVVHGWSIRKVLDPTDSFDDFDLLESLKDVSLLNLIDALPYKLETTIQLDSLAETHETLHGNLHTATKRCCTQINLPSSFHYSYYRFTASELLRLMIARLRITRIPYQLILVDEYELSHTQNNSNYLNDTRNSNLFDLALLRSLFPAALILVVTHSIAVIRSCDQLWMLSNGNIKQFHGPFPHMAISSFQQLLKKYQ